MRHYAASVGTPSNRSPPPGLGITTRRAGDGRYVPASRAARTCPQCSCSHGRNWPVVMPSAPGAPRLASTRLSARPRFSRESNRSHSGTSRPGMTASPGRAARPLRSAAVLNGTHRLLPPLARVRGMAAITATGTSTPAPPSHLTFGPSQPPSDPGWYYGLC